VLKKTRILFKQKCQGTDSLVCHQKETVQEECVRCFTPYLSPTRFTPFFLFSYVVWSYRMKERGAEQHREHLGLSSSLAFTPVQVGAHTPPLHPLLLTVML